MKRAVLNLAVGVMAGLVLIQPAVASEAVARPSAGCGGTAPPAVGESTRLSMTVDGLEREYLVHLPPGYDPEVPASLVLDFHGYTGDSSGEEVYTRLSEHADRQGFVVVYPQGTGFLDGDRKITSWNDLAGSASPGPEGPICAEDAFQYPHPPECVDPGRCDWATCHDDLGFIEAILDRLEATLCVDLDRVYATGMSNGGMFVHRLGCDLPERFAAIAPVGATLARGFNCAPDRSTPLSMMNIYGSGDDYVSQKGDKSSDGYFYTAAEDLLDKWGGQDKQDCDATSTPFETSRDGVLGMACVQRANCSTGAEVVHCTWDGGHDWPQDETSNPGNEIIWEFFSRHSRAGYSKGAAEDFRSSSTVEEVRRRIERLPEDDSWWTVNGLDMAWNNKNLHRIFPTVNVYRSGPVRRLEDRPMEEIGDYEVDTPGGKVRFADFLRGEDSTSMGMVILHRGEIVFEDYPRMEPYERPIFWSVTKVLVSAVVAILEARGEVDIDAPIESYIPELAGSSYDGIRVRSLLDMASGVDCPEEYYDREACYYGLMETTGEAHWDADSPVNPYEYIAALEVGRFAEQGTSFEYGSINTYILGWLVEKLTGMPFQDAFSREIWTRIGAEGDAAILAPRYGVPLFAGGFLGRLRDMARFGLLFTPSYTTVTERRLIPEAHVETLKNGGNPELLANARGGRPEWLSPQLVKHNVYQWDLVYANNDIYKGGWAGQGLLVNPDRDLVAVYVGYFNDDQSELDVLPRLRQVLDGVFGEAASGK